MKQYNYTASGVCAKNILITVDENNIVKEVKFLGGGPGNQQGVAKLAIDRPAEEVAKLLTGIQCGPKPTSCPDQLARALAAIAAKK